MVQKSVHAVYMNASAQIVGENLYLRPHSFARTFISLSIMAHTAELLQATCCIAYNPDGELHLFTLNKK